MGMGQTILYLGLGMGQMILCDGHGSDDTVPGFGHGSDDTVRQGEAVTFRFLTFTLTGIYLVFIYVVDALLSKVTCSAV